MRVKTIQTAKAGTPLESYAYVYDKNGNRTLQTKTAGTTTETLAKNGLAARALRNPATPAIASAPLKITGVNMIRRL